MLFKVSQIYTQNEIRAITYAYEQSHNVLLTERKVRMNKKTSFKLICVKNVKTSCPFHLSFTHADNGDYEFNADTSCQRHNHGKFSKKIFQTQFFKRDFKLLEEPLKETFERNFEKLKDFKPKGLLKLLNDQKTMPFNIMKGFALYHKTFKKKFDNLVRKVKVAIQNDYTNNSLVLSSLSTEAIENSMKQEFDDDEGISSEGVKEMVKKEDEGVQTVNTHCDAGNDDFNEKSGGLRWIVPFNF